MEQKEFENRVKMPVSYNEYQAIEVVYMNSDLEKDEFCKLWSKMNLNRIHKHIEKLKKEEELQKMKDYLYDICINYENLPFDSKVKPAPLLLKSIEIKLINKAGINLQIDELINGVPYYKSLLDVLYEIKVYLKIA